MIGTLYSSYSVKRSEVYFVKVWDSARSGLLFVATAAVASLTLPEGLLYRAVADWLSTKAVQASLYHLCSHGYTASTWEDEDKGVLRKNHPS